MISTSTVLNDMQLFLYVDGNDTGMSTVWERHPFIQLASTSGCLQS